MNTLRDELINKIKNMPEEWLFSINQAVSGLSEKFVYTGYINECPYCGGHIIKNGTQCGRQRHLCKCCGRTFTCTVNTILYRSRTDEELWKEVLSDTIAFISIDKTAGRLGLTHDHVFHMRHKFLAAMAFLKKRSICHVFG